MDACVGMTGCPGSDDVEFTILSKRLAKSSMFLWNRNNGTVEMILNDEYLVCIFF